MDPQLLKKIYGDTREVKEVLEAIDPQVKVYVFDPAIKGKFTRIRRESPRRGGNVAK